MFRLFRQLRQRFLTENKVSKYVLYVIIEIFIVIIGILIAIRFDNWNEERIRTENTKLLFKNVSAELVQNIKSIDRIINIDIQKDSLYFKVLNKRVERKDYIATPFLAEFPFLWDRTSLVDEDFRELVARKNKLTELQDSIFSELKELYGTRKINTDKDDKTVMDTQHSFRNKMNNEQPWFSDLYLESNFTDEMIQFWLTDPYYLNQLTELHFREYWRTMGLLWFRSKALNLHKNITDMLKIEKDTSLFKDIKDFERIKGIYDWRGEATFHIIGKNELKLIVFLNDSSVFAYDIHPYSNSHLIIYRQEKGDNYLDRIVFGKNGEVLGLINFGDMMEVDGNRRMNKKIE